MSRDGKEVQSELKGPEVIINVENRKKELIFFPILLLHIRIRVSDDGN